MQNIQANFVMPVCKQCCKNGRLLQTRMPRFICAYMYLHGWHSWSIYQHQFKSSGCIHGQSTGKTHCSFRLFANNWAASTPQQQQYFFLNFLLFLFKQFSCVYRNISSKPGKS